MRDLLIIENEDSVRDTLGSYAEKLGYNPILISDPSVCNSMKSGEQRCSAKKPCADTLLIDKDLPAIDGLRLIELQKEKGCKVASQRKALMASTLVEEESKMADRLGCHVIQKPVTCENLESWLVGQSS
jgi:DNA-binding response OmpR family regulator